MHRSRAPTLVSNIPQQWDTDKLDLPLLCLDTFLEHYMCLVYIHWSSQSHIGDHCTLQIVKDNNYTNILQGCKCNIDVSESFICKGPFTIDTWALFNTLRSECFSSWHNGSFRFCKFLIHTFSYDIWKSHSHIVLATVYNSNQNFLATQIFCPFCSCADCGRA